jgi:hypothetical protein
MNETIAVKKRFSLAALILAVFLGALSAGQAVAEEAKDFRYSKALERSAAGLSSFYLDLETLCLAAPGLEDLRITDAKGRFVPFFMEDEASKTETRSWKLKAVEIEKGMAGEKGKERPFAVYQITGSQGGSEAEDEAYAANALGISFSVDDEFSAEILVEGKTDDTGWRTVARDSLYSLEGAVKRELTLTTVSDCNFYKISVLSGTAGIRPISLSPRYDENLESTRAFMREVSVLATGREEKDGSSRIKLDVPAGFPLSALLLDIDGRFDRDCELLGSGEFPIAYGRLNSRAGASSGQSIECGYRAEKAGELTLVIHNGDDRPLEIRGIRAEYRTRLAVFEAAEGQMYSVLFGKADAQRPVYDIQSFASDFAASKKKELKLGSLDDRGAKGRPAAEKIPFRLIFNIVIAVTGAALIALIIVLLRKQKR